MWTLAFWKRRHTTVSGLLFGSLPGVWLGSFLAGRIPEGALRPIVAMLLFITGVKLI
ncbi:MAG: hypothetical protein DMG76_36630 [Acidobacteria bacterium]|nr:MAG: hypothetical protein DMG76_36630 [Acidobacteriota bacterium]